MHVSRLNSAEEMGPTQQENRARNGRPTRPPEEQSQRAAFLGGPTSSFPLRSWPCPPAEEQSQPGGLGSGGTALPSLPSPPPALQGQVPVISDCPSISVPGLWVRLVSTGQRTGGVCTSPGRSSATSGDTSPRSIFAFWDTGIHGLDLPSLRSCVVIWLPECFLSSREKHKQFSVLLLPLSC